MDPQRRKWDRWHWWLGLVWLVFSASTVVDSVRSDVSLFDWIGAGVWLVVLVGFCVHTVRAWRRRQATSNTPNRESASGSA